MARELGIVAQHRRTLEELDGHLRALSEALTTERAYAHEARDLLTDLVDAFYGQHGKNNTHLLDAFEAARAFLDS